MRANGNKNIDYEINCVLIFLDLFMQTINYIICVNNKLTTTNKEKQIVEDICIKDSYHSKDEMDSMNILSSLLSSDSVIPLDSSFDGNMFDDLFNLDNQYMAVAMESKSFKRSS